MTFCDGLRRLSADNTHLLDDLELITKLFVFIVINTPRFLSFFSRRRAAGITPSGTAAICGIQIFIVELFFRP